MTVPTPFNSVLRAHRVHYGCRRLGIRPPAVISVPRMLMHVHGPFGPLRGAHVTQTGLGRQPATAQAFRVGPCRVSLHHAQHLTDR